MEIDIIVTNCNKIMIYPQSSSYLVNLLFIHSVLSDTLWPHGLCTEGFPVLHHLQGLLKLMHIEFVAPSTISSCVIPFSSCFQSFPTSGSFSMSQVFALGGQSIRVSASASVLSMNIQDWFLLGLIGLISLQTKGLSIVFSTTMVQKHQYLSTQSSLWSTSHTDTWLLEKP